MNTSSDIWIAFARTFSMLFLVLALLILVFYLVKKFSMAKGGTSGKNHIRVLSAHHFSPKEKLVLVDVMGDIILVGVTPTNISKISLLDKDVDFSDQETEPGFKFSDFLAQKLGASFKNRKTPVVKKVEKQ